MTSLDFAVDREIDLNDLDGFRSQPEEAIAASFDWLRRNDPVRFFEEPRYRSIASRPGYWAAAGLPPPLALEEATRRALAAEAGTLSTAGQLAEALAGLLTPRA